MGQTTLSVVLEVVPASAGRLSGLIDKFKNEKTILGSGAVIKIYDRLQSGVPTLHFMSMSVFQGADYDPLFVIEANFDGQPGPFWAQVEATIGDHLRPMLRCCKRPLDSDGPLYDAITGSDSRYPLAPYLERRTLPPSVFHHGNRGLDRERILREGKLFIETRVELGQSNPSIPNPYRGINAQQIHQRLRAALLGKFPWLGEPAPARITARERAGDLLRLFGFLLVVLFTLSIPGLLLLVFFRAFAPEWASWFLALDLVPLLMLLIVPVIAGLVLFATRSARPGEAAPTRSGGLSPSMKNDLTSFANPVTLFVTVVIVLGLLAVAIAAVGAAVQSVFDVALRPAFLQMSQAFQEAYGEGFFHALGQALRAFNHALYQGILSFVPAVVGAFKQSWGPMVRLAIVGIYTVFVFSIPAIFVWLRWLERRDAHHDAPPVDQRELRMMTHLEDWIPQNHMGSVVLVKPGVLRMALFRTGHLGLGLLLRVLATDGYLGSMRTVHFAHWAFVNNGSRLMFLSNFDNSWDSYLDDFIEKAHGGLTLAWGSGVGFPATRFLVLDGASHGRQFKAWARHSMAVSRFWFSAYTDYTVDQIERHARIADGLRKATLARKEAATWARDL
jgi:hypothetical protein